MILNSINSFSATPEENLKSLGIKLSAPPKRLGNYVHFTRSGNTIYLAGKGPSLQTGGYMQGKLGKDLSIAQGQKAAELTIINQLGILKSAIGDLSKVKKVLRVSVFVNSTDSFTKHPSVADGASNFLIKVFGKDIGQHSRTAVGSNSLPMNIPVEISLIVEVNN